MQTLRVNVGQDVRKLAVQRVFRDSRNHRPPIAMTPDGRFTYLSGLPVTDETHLEIVPDQYRFTHAQARELLVDAERELARIKQGTQAGSDDRVCELERVRARMHQRLANPANPGTVRLETSRQIVTEPGVSEDEFHAEIVPHRAQLPEGAETGPPAVVTREQVGEMVQRGLEPLAASVAALTKAVGDLVASSGRPGVAQTGADTFSCLQCAKSFKTVQAQKAHLRKVHPAGASGV